MKWKKELAKGYEGDARLMKLAGRRLESFRKTGTEKRKKKTIPGRCNPESIDDEDGYNDNDGGNDDHSSATVRSSSSFKTDAALSAALP